MSDRVDFSSKSGLKTGVLAPIASLNPGAALCALVTLVAVMIQAFQGSTVGSSQAEAIVIVILLGTAIRTIWEPGPRWHAGMAFSAKRMLEVAVALLGASITFAAIAASGLVLLSAIVATVVLTIAVSYGISRSLGLSARLSILLAYGNAMLKGSPFVHCPTFAWEVSGADLLNDKSTEIAVRRDEPESWS